MKNLEIIGLNEAKANLISEKLNMLLADYSVFYQNTRGFHWHIKGPSFFELHEKFEELYNDLAEKIDEIAERILTLGHTPGHTYSGYLKLSGISETGVVSDGKEAVGHILSSLKTITASQRELLALAGNADDEGTVALISGYIQSQEKTVWMYNSYLGQ